jgi:hypothetical protein
MAGQGSARVTLKEIDLSQVRDPEQLPQGVPAAVVGPAKRGPAFVPKTFANMQKFGEVFGSMSEISKESNANRFGPLALNEWMRNAQAGTFVRTLGIGSSEGRMNDDKTVAGAGFVVGNKISYDNDNKLQDNQHAYLDPAELDQATEAARTHFLGCFMKDTSGSTFLQDAGVQTSTAQAKAQIRFANLPTNGDFIVLKFINPSNASQSFTETFEFTGGAAVSIVGAIAVNQGANVDATVTALKTAIEGNDNGYDIVPTISSEGDNANTDPHTIEILQKVEGEAGNTVIAYQFNPTGGDINDITVNEQTSSNSSQDYVLGITGDVAGQCVITITDLPTNNSTILLDGLSNDGAGTISANKPVTFKFVTANLASDAASDNVADRFSATSVSACSIHIADSKEETLQNLTAAINRPAANNGGSLLNTSGLLVAELFNNNTQLRVTQVNGGAASGGASGCDVVVSVTDTKLSVEAAANNGDSLTLTSTGANQSGKFANGADGSVASFKLTLSGQPVDGEEIEIEVVTDPDTPTVVTKTFIFNDSGVNGNDAGGGKVLVKIADDDVERTLYNLYDTIVGTDANLGRGGALAAVAATLEISVTDGDAGKAGPGYAAGTKITLTSHDGTIVDYILTDTVNAGAATGDELQQGEEVSSDTNATASLTADATGIAVGIQTISSRGFVLNQLRDAINNGDHAGKLLATGSAVNMSANGPQTLTITQVAGFEGNTTVTDNLDADFTIPANFSGGLDGFSASSVDVLPDEDAIEFKQLQNISLVHKLTSAIKMGDRAVVTNPDGDRLVGNVGQKSTAFEQGGGAARPVIRGLLMSPQGVIPAMEQSDAAYNALSTERHKQKVTLNDTTLRSFGANAAQIAGYEIGSISSDQSFALVLNGFKSEEEPSVLACSFDPESVNYFAKVLNTDPAQIESRGHYLYAHWDIDRRVSTPSDVGVLKRDGSLANISEVGFCLHSSGNPRESATLKPDFESFNTRFRTAKSPWFKTQSFGAESYNLFKLHSLDDGEAGNDRFRILISNIIAPENEGDWGSFDLTLEGFYSDPVSGEGLITWKRLSFDPDSKNFIGRVIGDKHMYYDFDRAASKQRLVEEGDFEVKNNYVRVELSELVKSGEIPSSSLPCAFEGYRTLNTAITGLFNEQGAHAGGSTKLLADDIFDGLEVLPLPFVKTITRASGESFEASEALSWGIKFAKKKTAGENNETSEIRFNSSIQSWTKFWPDMTDGVNATFGKDSAEAFSLEKIAVPDSSSIDWSKAEYSRSGTAPSSKTFIALGEAAKSGRNVKYLKFRCLMQGGFNGLDIFNKEKAAMSSAAAFREASDENGDGIFSGATIQMYKRAIDVLADKSATELQLLAIPGIREPAVTNYAITACESRFDAMFVMDIEESDSANATIISSSVKPNVTQTISKFSSRQLDTSFAAAYFPDVISRRPSNGSPLQVPPSVCMLGVMSQNDTLADPWFAPAGLTRGRLSALNSKIQMNRDVLNDLYDADINPIYEPAGRAGEVYAFGQKTLMQSQSALDRINVRRLLINLRRQVKAIANSLLFEPNRASTLARFSSLVEPIMSNVQARQGVERYKVQIDTSTTTQNDVENNTIRGKIYLQPTKSVEFISLDFVVTNSID